MKFIDLFAGLGGFHKALGELGHKCVFASELDPTLRELYKVNWDINPYGDIKSIVKESIYLIPEHDILCAGFPCQPFSKAGKKLGLMDENHGNLFEAILSILEKHKPRYFILENVPFIAKHDNEKTWKTMHESLKKIGYQVKKDYFSPHQFGIPQHRFRMFIVGEYGDTGLKYFSFEEIISKMSPITSLTEFLDTNPDENLRYLSSAQREVLVAWQMFLDSLPKSVGIPTFPIWSMEFGASYPFEDLVPVELTEAELGNYTGNFGISLRGLSKFEQIKNLPSYARTESEFPKWKKNYIKKNREFFNEYSKFLWSSIKVISSFDSQSWQKLEWNVGRAPRKLLDYIIQFRASGIRVKKNDYFPSLVCTSTQIPIIGWKNRFISRTEALRLQSLEGLKLPDQDNAAFKALGNAVNAKIVKLVAEELIK